MDASELKQPLQTPKPPAVSAENNNHGTIRSRTREVTSRYRSPAPRRSTSPNITKAGTTPYATIPKRAVSAERRRPSTPPSPPSPTTPVHDTSIDMQLASRKLISSKLPESLWPSRARSLSVSFQSDAFSMPIGKREKEKPITPAITNRTLKPSLNSSHKQVVTPPGSRKPTPERKRSPLKGKNSIDQLENSIPAEGLNSRQVDQHRWPSRSTPKFSSNYLSKSIDLSDWSAKNPIMPNSGVGVSSFRRMSLPDHMGRPLQKSSSDAARLVTSVLGSERLEFDNLLRIPKVLSSSSIEKEELLTPAVRFQSLSTSGSRPPSRGMSPSQTRALSQAPSRGVSPSRIRSSSPSRQSNSSNPTSVLTFTADIRNGKKVNQIEDVHHLRLLYNRLFQWRFANAQAEASVDSQKVAVETTLNSVWRTVSELLDAVAMKRIALQQWRLKLKLFSVLNDQIANLNKWASAESDHSIALIGATEDLQASTLRLPVTSGTRASVETTKAAICSALQVMQRMESSTWSTLVSVGRMNCLVSDLALVVAQERAMLLECETLLASAAVLQIEEHSLRTQLIQLRQPWKSEE